ncbi:dinitrogenase iron-molybdenum cofactor biosynthesis protein [Candidatus Poribacteria bacterium]|nr:dinitrogenase iron-molybdenum cofactor biosynthesis protein [Candidatus Poribacteria bacterium]
MKIAVSAQDSNLDAKIDPRFGRAQCFLVVDPDTWDFEIVDNKQNLQAPAGAGIQAAQIVSDSGADAVLTFNCGPKAFRTLEAAGVKVYVGVEGTVKEAVEAFKAGKIKPTDSANVDAHSGI